MAQSFWRSSLSESMVKRVTDTLLEKEKIPIVNSAKLMLTDDGVRLSTSWSQRSFTEKAKKAFSRDYFLTTDLQKVVARSNPVPVESSESIATFSKNGSFKCFQILKSNENQFLEIWSDSGLEKVYNLGEIDLHGTVNFDAEFGSIAVNQSETILAYIAEKKKKKPESFFTQKKDEKNKGTEYSYNESWGEQMTDYSQSVIVLLNLKNDQFDVIDDKVLPAGLCPGQIVWTSDSSLVGIGISATPRRLGIVYCSNRPSNLFRLHVFDNKYEEIVESSVRSCKNPRVTPDGQKLIWLERGLKKPFPGPHQASFSLKSLDLKGAAAEIKTLVSEVYDFNIGTDSFAGFYIGSPPFPENCFTSEGDLVVSIPVVDTIYPAIIDLNSGEVSVQFELANVQIVDVRGNMIVGVKSTPVEVPSVMIGRFENKKSIVLRPLEENPVIAHPGTEFKTFIHVPSQGHPDPTYADVKFNSIYIGPIEGDVGKVPLIVWPHGGPHSVTLATFYRELTFFNALGYGVLLVNYRGSTGAGDKGIWSLLGHIGDTDVKDVYQATQECLQKVPQLNPDKVVLFGGSHGGFLVVHLAGQYPKAFKAVTARNPVINLATMIGLTDIPDWTMNESLNDYNFLVPSETTEMYNMSPTSHASNIEAPVLLQIGSEDLRVPPSQGYELFHKLRVLGKKVDMDVYPDNHPLGKIPVAGNVMISTALFFHVCLEDPVA